MFLCPGKRKNLVNSICLRIKSKIQYPSRVGHVTSLRNDVSPIPDKKHSFSTATSSIITLRQIPLLSRNVCVLMVYAISYEVCLAISHNETGFSPRDHPTIVLQSRVCNGSGGISGGIAAGLVCTCPSSRLLFPVFLTYSWLKLFLPA